jgi:large subunit ribosomal protein L9
MEVMLLKDVFKLGRAGDVKRVADGYGRNYLIPQGLATMATPGALKQTDRIRAAAELERARLNKELTAVHEQLNGLQLNFPVRAGETGKLYGSVTNQMISEAIGEQLGIEVDRHQIDSEPLKTLGVHTVSARLTVDLIPELTIVVHREDLPPESAFEVEEVEEVEEEAIGTFSDLQAELEAEEAEAAAAEQVEAPSEAPLEMAEEPFEEGFSEPIESPDEEDGTQEES